jgi:hypothetical protein
MTAGPWPTYDDLSEDLARLLAEVDTALSSNRWAILNTGSEHVRHRLYDAAALRHCCLLLREIEQSVSSGQDMTVRLTGRALLEAWIAAVYLHFGGYDALTKIIQDTLKQTETLDKDLKAFDQQLAKDKAKAEAKLARIQKANAGITKWNNSHPEKPPKPLLDEPHIPQLAPTDIDLSGRIADFSDFTARDLPVSEMVAALTKLGPEKSFANETFHPIYLLYRMLSTGGTHTNIHIYDSYFRHSYFTTTAPEPDRSPASMGTLVTALYSVALLAGWVLSEPGHPTPIASQLRDHLQPDPSGRSGWAPGT